MCLTAPVPEGRLNLHPPPTQTPPPAYRHGSRPASLSSSNTCAQTGRKCCCCRSGSRKPFSGPRLSMFWRFWPEMKGRERKEGVDGMNREKENTLGRTGSGGNLQMRVCLRGEKRALSYIWQMCSEFTPASFCTSVSGTQTLLSRCQCWIVQRLQSC